MEFQNELILALIDKGLLAVIALGAGYLFNKLLEDHKSRYSMLEAIAEQRVKAYQQLWQITKLVKKTRKNEMDDSEKKEMSETLTDWYFINGGGIFLHHQATSKFLIARDTLTDNVSELSKILEAFSSLRSQLKSDLRIYAFDERDKPTSEI